jgi:hypothetical protein|tara:strand:+ start:618 stop:818 length:201 start_codon:yes stop_codon:yes gene_type:complete
LKFTSNREEWREMGHDGTRLKYIKYYIKLFYSKLVGKKNSNKKETNKAEITTKKIRRNKFGFPVID